MNLSLNHPGSDDLIYISGELAGTVRSLRNSHNFAEAINKHLDDLLARYDEAKRKHERAILLECESRKNN